MKDRYASGSYWMGEAANFGATMVNGQIGGSGYGKSLATQGISRSFSLVGSAIGGVIDVGISGDWDGYGQKHDEKSRQCA